MDICLVRHAIAGERDENRWPDDRERPLTPDGIAKMQEAARGLRELFGATAILSSPLLRARETAEILMDTLDVGELHFSEALVSGDDEQLLCDIRQLRAQRICAVGHEPLMSQTLANLLTGSQTGMQAMFKKGAAALVSFSGDPTWGAGTLEWLIQPAGLRAIGAGVKR